MIRYFIICVFLFVSTIAFGIFVGTGHGLFDTDHAKTRAPVEYRNPLTETARRQVRNSVPPQSQTDQALTDQLQGISDRDTSEDTSETENSAPVEIDTATRDPLTTPSDDTITSSTDIPDTATWQTPSEESVPDGTVTPNKPQSASISPDNTVIETPNVDTQVETQAPPIRPESKPALAIVRKKPKIQSEGLQTAQRPSPRPQSLQRITYEDITEAFEPIQQDVSQKNDPMLNRYYIEHTSQIMIGTYR